MREENYKGALFLKKRKKEVLLSMGVIIPMASLGISIVTLAQAECALAATPLLSASLAGFPSNPKTLVRCVFTVCLSDKETGFRFQEG